MAVVTIVLVDTPDGNVAVRTVSDPEMPDGPETATNAQKTAVMMIGSMFDTMEHAGVGVQRLEVSADN